MITYVLEINEEYYEINEIKRFTVKITTNSNKLYSGMIENRNKI